MSSVLGFSIRCSVETEQTDPCRHRQERGRTRSIFAVVRGRVQPLADAPSSMAGTVGRHTVVLAPRRRPSSTAAQPRPPPSAATHALPCPRAALPSTSRRPTIYPAPALGSCSRHPAGRRCVREDRGGGEDCSWSCGLSCEWIG
jgi:hypothetical protein